MEGQAIATYKFEFDRLPPTLNTYLRMHWTRRDEIITAWAWHFKQQALDLRIEDTARRARIKFVVRGMQAMDRDNLWARFKVVGDAMQRSNLLENDSDKHISLEVTWERAKRKRDVRCTVEMEVLEWAPRT